jgi:hypothetical protein
MAEIEMSADKQPEDNFERLKPPFKRSAEAERLFEHLISRDEGQLVTYESIARLIEEDPTRGAGYAITRGVRERLIKEYSVVWFVIPTVGLQRANASEMLEISDGNLQSVKRKIRRTSRITVAASSKYAELDTEQKTEFNFLMSVTGALSQLFNRAKTKEIKAKIKASQTVMESGEVLRLFGGEK